MGWESVDMSWFTSHNYPSFTVDNIDLGRDATHGVVLVYVQQYRPGKNYGLGVELQNTKSLENREDFFAEHIVQGRKVNVVIFPHVEAGEYLLAPPMWLAQRIGYSRFPIKVVAEEIAQADWREFG